jgi:hypothetical protein
MDRTYYDESEDQYYRSRGERAKADERHLAERRRELARKSGGSVYELDIDYLVGRRKEILYRWFALLKWLRQGLLKSGDPARKALLGGIVVEGGGAVVQTHRADVEDFQAAHLMHCNLRFAYRGRFCDAFSFLKGNRASTIDYGAFARNIFAATVNVWSVVNEIDSYLELHGATTDLATLSTQALRAGLEPDQALNHLLASYGVLIGSCKALYPRAIDEYTAGSDSLEARIEKGQSVSTLQKKHRKLSLFDVYLDKVTSAKGLDAGMMGGVNAAYRSRHEEWGTAPNRLL